MNNRERAALRIIKNAKHDELKGYWEYQEKQIFGDGYRLIVLYEFLNIPKLECKISEKFVNFLNLPNDHIKLNVPTIKELEALKKQNKALHKKDKASKYTYKKSHYNLYDFGINMPLVNLDYLIDMLIILPNSEVYVGRTDKKSALFFISTFGFGALCPILRSPDKV